MNNVYENRSKGQLIAEINELQTRLEELRGLEQVRIRTEDKFRQLSMAVEQSPSVIMITDLYGNIEYVNPKFTQLTGYTAEEVQGENPRILKSDNRPPEDYKEMWNTISEGSEWRGEFLNKKKNGEFFWESASISPIKNNSGEITHYIAVKEDITEKKKIEEALNEIAEKYSAFTGEKFLSAIVDYLTRIFKVDYAFVGRVVGQKRDKMQTVAVSSNGKIIDNFEYDLLNTPCEKVLRKSFYCYSSRIQESFPKFELLAALGCESYAGSPLFDSRQRSSGVLGILHNKPINNCRFIETILKILAVRTSAELERGQAEEALRQSEEKYRGLVETSHHLIWRCDKKGKITYLNPAWEKTHGFKTNDMVGCQFSEFQSKEFINQDNGEFKKRLSGGLLLEYETTHISQSGREVYLVFNAIPLIDKSGKTTGTQGTAYDITDRKRAEAELIESKKQLNIAERLAATGKLSASIAHEINNPLQAILANLASFESSLPPDFAEKIRLEKIKMGTKRIKEIIKQLLDIHRSKSFEKKIVNVSEVIESTINLLESQLLVNNITVKVDIRDKSITINGFAQELYQVFMNIILNAIDAMVGGGRLNIRSEVKNNNVNMFFKDNGCGISKKEIDHIFEPFFTTKTEVLGTGLGLSTSKGIIESMDGKIDVTSSVGKGSTFKISLPTYNNKQNAYELK